MIFDMTEKDQKYVVVDEAGQPMNDVVTVDLYKKEYATLNGDDSDGRNVIVHRAASIDRDPFNHIITIHPKDDAKD